jgi:chromosome segregation ATPase
MKKTLILGFVVSLLLAPVLVSAQVTTTRPNIPPRIKGTTTRPDLPKKDELKTKLQDRLQERKDVVEERKETLQGKREELKEKFQEKRGEFNELRKERIDAFFNRMMKRISTAFERLSGLVERIESRIAKLEQNNKNIQTQEAKGFLAEAKTKIANGKAFLQSAEDKADDILSTATSTSQTPRAVFGEVKELVNKAVSELRGAHESIKKAVRSLKASGGSNTGTTTTGTSN